MTKKLYCLIVVCQLLETISNRKKSKTKRRPTNRTSKSLNKMQFSQSWVLIFSYMFTVSINVFTIIHSIFLFQQTIDQLIISTWTNNRDRGIFATNQSHIKKFSVSLSKSATWKCFLRSKFHWWNGITINMLFCLFLRLEGVETLKYRCLCRPTFGKV